MLIHVSTNVTEQYHNFFVPEPECELISILNTQLWHESNHVNILKH